MDISSYWWSCLCGLLVWFFPMKGYCPDRDTEQKVMRDHMINGILGAFGLVLVIFLYSLFRSLRTELAGAVKIAAVMLGFLFLLGFKMLLRQIQQKQFCTRPQEYETVMIRLEFPGISQIIKCVILNIFLQGLLGLSFVFIYIFAENVSGLYFMVLLGIWIFLSAGEWTKNPFNIANVLFEVKRKNTVDEKGYG